MLASFFMQQILLSPTVDRLCIVPCVAHLCSKELTATGRYLKVTPKSFAFYFEIFTSCCATFQQSEVSDTTGDAMKNYS